MSASNSAENLARKMYDDYCEAVGGKAFNGDPLPNSSEFFNDETKQKQANAWRVAAATAIESTSKWWGVDLSDPIAKQESFMDRLLKERNELQDRTGKLESFLTKPDCKEIVGVTQHELLTTQFQRMSEYLTILNCRIFDLEGAKAGSEN